MDVEENTEKAKKQQKPTHSGRPPAVCHTAHGGRPPAVDHTTADDDNDSPDCSDTICRVTGRRCSFIDNMACVIAVVDISVSLC